MPRPLPFGKPFYIAIDLDGDYLRYNGERITDHSKPEAIDYALDYQLSSHDVDFQVFVRVDSSVGDEMELLDYLYFELS